MYDDWEKTWSPARYGTAYTDGLAFDSSDYDLPFCSIIFSFVAFDSLKREHTKKASLNTREAFL